MHTAPSYNDSTFQVSKTLPKQPVNLLNHLEVVLPPPLSNSDEIQPWSTFMITLSQKLLSTMAWSSSVNPTLSAYGRSQNAGPKATSTNLFQKERLEMIAALNLERWQASIAQTFCKDPKGWKVVHQLQPKIQAGDSWLLFFSKDHQDSSRQRSCLATLVSRSQAFSTLHHWSNPCRIDF